MGTQYADVFSVNVGTYLRSVVTIACTCIPHVTIMPLFSIIIIAGWFVAVQTLESIGLACLIITLLISMVLLLAVTNVRLSKVTVHVCGITGEAFI